MEVQLTFRLFQFLLLLFFFVVVVVVLLLLLLLLIIVVVVVDIIIILFDKAGYRPGSLKADVDLPQDSPQF